VQRRVTEAHDRAVDAVLGWVESQAHTRMRRVSPRFVDTSTMRRCHVGVT
jgi:hypothetical protein